MGVTFPITSLWAGLIFCLCCLLGALNRPCSSGVEESCRRRKSILFRFTHDIILYEQKLPCVLYYARHTVVHSLLRQNACVWDGAKASFLRSALYMMYQIRFSSHNILVPSSNQRRIMNLQSIQDQENSMPIHITVISKMAKRGSCISVITMSDDEFGSPSVIDEDEECLYRSVEMGSSSFYEFCESQDRFSSSNCNQASPCIPQRKGSFALHAAAAAALLIPPNNNTNKRGSDALPSLPHRRGSLIEPPSAFSAPADFKNILPPVKPSRQVSNNATA